MDRQELEAWLRLTLTPGVGNDTARRLLAAFGLPQHVFAQSSTALRQLLTPAQASALAQPPDDLATQLQTCLDWLDAAEDGMPRRIVSLGDAAYPVAEGHKVVRYWSARVAKDNGFTPDAEVDELRWVSPGLAAEMLSYVHDLDVLRRFGYYSTESNGHLSEYLPWYRKRADEIMQWIDMSDWINGETGGYLRFSSEGHAWFETDFPKWMAEDAPIWTPESRSLEHGSYIIEALETGRIYRGHFNVMNDGILTNLPDDCVIEVPGYVDRNGVNIPKIGDLPIGCAAVCNASISVQRLAVEAAVHGDVMLLKQAMMMDPLVGAVCATPEISQMTDEMLVAEAEWLPQYEEEIPAARARLKAEKPLGTKQTRGAARKARAA